MAGEMEQLFSVVGRVYVILRRETNRMIDVEWTITNAEYAREVIRLARATRVDELIELANRIEDTHPLLPRSLSDLRLIYCVSGKSGPFLPAFSLHRPTMRLEIVQDWPRSPTRLATIAQVRQAPRIKRVEVIPPTLSDAPKYVQSLR